MLCVRGVGRTLVVSRRRARRTVVVVIVVMLMGRCCRGCIGSNTTRTAWFLSILGLVATRLAALSANKRSGVRDGTVEGSVSRTRKKRFSCLASRRQRMSLIVPERGEVLFLVPI